MKHRILICLLVMVFISHSAHAQYRSAAFTMQNTPSAKTVTLPQTFQTDGNVPLSLSSPIYSFSISGSATLNDTSNSLIRVTLVDNYDMEYLVYEIYPLLTDRWQFDFENMAFETSDMGGINATKINITVLNAELTMNEYHYTTEPAKQIQRQQRFKSQQQYVIETLNANLEARNMPWRAGETSVSGLSYEEKKNLFGGTVPNLNGFEYYVGGIFVMPDYQPQQELQAKANASLPSAWDWRNVNGKNWMTPVKDQGSCGSCWAFATLGAFEAYINIFYNQLLNLDLSEQDLVSCYKGNGCLGGNAWSAFDYIRRSGVVTENCLPYRGTDGKCSSKCKSPNEVLKVSSYMQFNSTLKNEDDLKQLLLQYPMTLGISSWEHSMVLAGYKTIQKGDRIYTSSSSYVTIVDNDPLIGSTAWLVKNSWGKDFGEQGYAYVSMKWKDMKDIVMAKGDIDGITSIKSSVYWSENPSIGNIVLIEQGGTLYISTTLDMGTGIILVQNGGKLIVDGGILTNAAIEVENGGQLQIINNGTVKLRNDFPLDIPKGATLDIRLGTID